MLKKIPSKIKPINDLLFDNLKLFLLTFSLNCLKDLLDYNQLIETVCKHPVCQTSEKQFSSGKHSAFFR